MKKGVLTFATAGLILTSLSIHAACPYPSGWYLEANGGETTMSGKSYPGSSSIGTSGTAWNANAGYKIFPYMALEGGYTRYAATRIKNSLGQTAARDNHYAVDVAAKGILPFASSGFELFGKLGVGGSNSKISSINTTAAAVNGMTFSTGSNTSVGLYWGGGAEYYFNPNFAANLQYAQVVGNSKTGNMGIYSAGISFLISPS